MEKYQLKKHNHIGFLVILILICSLVAQETPIQPNVVEKLSDSLYRIGSAQLDKDKKEISLSGQINMNEGLIEVLACGRKGKLHESVLVLDVAPHDVQVALLLLGLNHQEAIFNEDSTQVIAGDEITIQVTWEEDGITKTVHGEELVIDVVNHQPIQNARWIFLGSEIVNGHFMADVEETIIATYHDPYAIIDNGSQGANNDELYIANTGLLPPINTSVTVILKYVH